MNGLDLFSGIGGITKALEGYVRPVAYCENDRYAQAVLLSRMASGDLPNAPVWEDVRTLNSRMLPRVEIIYGGFPCQDLSVAGRGAGLAGKRSGLFFEIVRLAGEVRPAFIFLENVPAIRSRGGDLVVGELARLGYDARWDVLSAADVGANHRRERWWLLAHANGNRIKNRAGEFVGSGSLADSKGERTHGSQQKREPDTQRISQNVADTYIKPEGGLSIGTQSEITITDFSGENEQIPNTVRSRRNAAWSERSSEENRAGSLSQSSRSDWWSAKCRLGIASHGVHGTLDCGGWECGINRLAKKQPHRSQRLKALGNAVVPQTAREAFERLMGLK